MTLSEAKVMLEKRRIPYQTAQYENQAEFYLHLSPFSTIAHAKSCKVIALVIPSVNGVKDIELEFDQKRGEYVFVDLFFGDFCFEMFDCDPELLEADVLDIIGQIVDGKLAVIVSNDLKRKRWVMDSSFMLTDDDEVFGEPGFREAVAKAEAPKTFWQKLTGRKLQYDIYDWRTYRQILK